MRIRRNDLRRIERRWLGINSFFSAKGFILTLFPLFKKPNEKAEPFLPRKQKIRRTLRRVERRWLGIKFSLPKIRTHSGFKRQALIFLWKRFPCLALFRFSQSSAKLFRSAKRFRRLGKCSVFPKRAVSRTNFCIQSFYNFMDSNLSNFRFYTSNCLFHNSNVSGK